MITTFVVGFDGKSSAWAVNYFLLYMVQIYRSRLFLAKDTERRVMDYFKSSFEIRVLYFVTGAVATVALA